MTAIDPITAPDPDRDARRARLFTRINTADKWFQVLGLAWLTPLLKAAAGDSPRAQMKELWRLAAVPLIANVLAAPVTDPTQIRQHLVEQVTGTVRWRESMDWLGANGVERVAEIGAGKVLTGMAKRMLPDAEANSAGTPEDVAALAAALKN